MRTITPELAALLRDRFQVAGSGHRARFEFDLVAPATIVEGEPLNLAQEYGMVVLTQNWGSTSGLVGDNVKDGTALTGVTFGSAVKGAGTWARGVAIEFDEPRPVDYIRTCWSSSNVSAYGGVYYWDPTVLDVITGDLGAYVPIGINETVVDTTEPSDRVSTDYTRHTFPDGPVTSDRWLMKWEVTQLGLRYVSSWIVYEFQLWGASAETSIPGEVTPVVLRPSRINLNKNLRMGPDQAEITIPNETLGRGFGPTSVFATNSRCRTYQWFGDPENEVLTFTGVIDKVADNRDPLTTTLTCRSLAGPILVDQTFSTTGPQTADESGAVLTEDNGVYAGREVDYIVGDILERAGWPADSIDVAETSFVLDSFLVEDGASWWDTLERLAGFVGYTLWDDEDAVIHFRTLGDQAAVDETLTADYEYEIGVGL